MLEIQEREGAVTFLLRVQPRASKDEIAGEMGGALKVRLQAPLSLITIPHSVGLA